MCKTCNLKHVRRTTRPIERSLVNIDFLPDSTVKKKVSYDKLRGQIDENNKINDNDIDME